MGEESTRTVTEEMHMNYHYIEFMIKERQRLELEECERNRMLRAARDVGTCCSDNRKVSILKYITTLVQTIFWREQHVSLSGLSNQTHLEKREVSV